MAIIYRATLVPTKLELISNWLPRQPWCDERAAEFEALGAFRFDDPYGEVGLETHLVRGRSGTIYQVPLSYRAAPMANAGRWLVGELEHSVLGHRWVYDACADPVYAPALVEVIAAGAPQALEEIVGEPTPVPSSVQVRGTGELPRAPQATLIDLDTTDGVTTIRTDSCAILVWRRGLEPRDDRLRLDAVSGVTPGPVTLAAIVSS